MTELADGSFAAHVEHTIQLPVRDDGPKGYYGPPVELLLMSDGSVKWRYDSD